MTTKGRLHCMPCMLLQCVDSLVPQDASLSEALFYLHVLAVAASDSPQEVMAATPGLQDALKHLASALGTTHLREQQRQQASVSWRMHSAKPHWLTG